MSGFQNIAQAYVQGFGTKQTDSTVVMQRTPQASDVNYPIGTLWIDQLDVQSYYLLSLSNASGQLQADWQLISKDSVLVTLSDTANANIVSPSSDTATPPNNIQIAGGSGIQVVGNPSTNTLTINNTGTSITLNGNTGTATPDGSGDIYIKTVNATPTFVGDGVNTVNLDFGPPTLTGNLALGSSLSSLSGGVDNTGLGGDIYRFITSGSNNTAVGNSALGALTSGNSNTALGFQTLDTVTTGSNNTSIGENSTSALSTGSYNTALGVNALDGLSSGTGNTAIGASAATNYTGSESSNIVIGNPGVTSDSHVIRIGDPNTLDARYQTSCYVAGISGVTVAASSPVAVSSTGQLSDLGLGTSGYVLTSRGAGLSPNWQAVTGGVTSVTGTANRITSTGGTTPQIDIAATYVGQSSITTLGTVTTGTWNASLIPLAYGGTNANLTASNGGIFYSTASAGAILSGTATANQILVSGSSSAPAWSTSTYPVTNNTGDIIYGSGTSAYSNLALNTYGGAPLISNKSTVAWGTPLQYFVANEDFLIQGGSNTIIFDTFNGGGEQYQTGLQTGGRMGVRRLYLTSNTSGANFYHCGTQNTKFLYTGSGLIQLTYIFKVEALSTVTDTYTIRIGMGDQYSGDYTDGVYFEYSDTGSTPAWTIKTANGGSRTTTTTSTNLDTNYHTYQIVINAAGTLVTYYIDGASVGTISTNIPTAPTTSIFQTSKSAGSTQNNTDVDFMGIYWALTTSR